MRGLALRVLFSTWAASIIPFRQLRQLPLSLPYAPRLLSQTVGRHFACPPIGKQTYVSNFRESPHSIARKVDPRAICAMRSPVRATALALFLCVALLAFAPSRAIASSTIRQMTFTDNPEYYDGRDAWLEDGITATGEFRYFNTPGTAHLDPGGTPYGGSVSFTTGSVFDALSIDINSPGGLFCAADNPSECDDSYPNYISAYDDPYPNVWITGFVEDELVSTLQMSRSTNGLYETVSLGDGFSQIDRLTVAVRHPIYSLGLTGACFVEYCGHFDLDNVLLRDVTPVPEPTTSLLLGFGIILLGIRRAD